MTNLVCHPCLLPTARATPKRQTCLARPRDPSSSTKWLRITCLPCKPFSIPCSLRAVISEPTWEQDAGKKFQKPNGAFGHVPSSEICFLLHSPGGTAIPIIQRHRQLKGHGKRSRKKRAETTCFYGGLTRLFPRRPNGPCQAIRKKNIPFPPGSSSDLQRPNVLHHKA